MVILKNCEPERSYVSSYVLPLSNKCLKESCSPDCLKVSSVVPIFKNIGNSLQLKTIVLLVFFLWLVKSLKNLAREMWPFF